MAGFEDVGTALALLRKRAGLTQDQIAERLALKGSNSVSAIESGNPRAQTIQRYLGALGCTPMDLAKALADLDYASGAARPVEIREAQSVDPLDRQLETLYGDLRAFVEVVKARTPKP